MALFDRLRDYSLTGIIDARSASVGDQCDIPIIEMFNDPENVGFCGSTMKTDYFRTGIDMIQDLSSDASIFCNDNSHFSEHAYGAHSEIFEVADGRGDNV